MPRLRWLDLSLFVMAGLVPAIHAGRFSGGWRRVSGLSSSFVTRLGVGGRDKPGHDGGES